MTLGMGNKGGYESCELSIPADENCEGEDVKHGPEAKKWGDCMQTGESLAGPPLIDLRFPLPDMNLLLRSFSFFSKTRKGIKSCIQSAVTSQELMLSLNCGPRRLPTFSSQPPLMSEFVFFLAKLFLGIKSWNPLERRRPRRHPTFRPQPPVVSIVVTQGRWH